MSPIPEVPACIMLVESDLLVRHPLAEYLRECGYRILEAADTDEARQLLDANAKRIDIILCDIDAKSEAGSERSGFALAAFVRQHHPGIQIILAGTVTGAVEKAGDLCEQGPALSKPYDHKLVLDHIKRLTAARDRNREKP